jgi:tripartite-type tricarboxylate transporter receptor subunit TctC
MTKFRQRRRRLALVLLSTAFLGAHSLIESVYAQTPFYKGKTLTIINGNPPGGTADRRMRAVIPFLKKYIPGEPAILPEFMPGAGGRQLASHM